jgi:hypothetical protein
LKRLSDERIAFGRRQATGMNSEVEMHLRGSTLNAVIPIRAAGLTPITELRFLDKVRFCHAENPLGA